MKIVNTPLIESYRTGGPCRWCNKKVRMRCAAHIFSKGAGQVDIKCNLVQLGMDALTDCPCHTYSHNGHPPTFDDLLAISAKDHRRRPEDIVQLIHFIRRLPKWTTAFGFVGAAKAQLDVHARALAMLEYEGFRRILPE
jgi:hypothetical protein